MSDNLPIGAENDSNAPYNEQEYFECSECGKKMATDKGVCSNKCFKASML